MTCRPGFSTFAGRVALARQSVLSGASADAFDACFKMFDGEMVAAALMRAAEKDAALADAMPKYFDMELLQEIHARHASTDLEAAAAVIRRKEAAQSRATAKRWELEGDGQAALF
ncbi:hypothetical protein [Ancylobacter pratisalsi]|uniref:Uncharacterized protein n=1 Tax=Ancylobacter pratisalsi TaxID=1745854 RepID=A0A6P1YSP9_9HYPH|nr:hypothetical protein [Ancylobacter pratisalsi]QIB36527.1 hypothetical protein G3A50_22175 [Ancylobacter pratisalsi]